MARAILAEGSSGALQIRTAPQWERFEARDPCRGFIGHSTNTRNVENDRGLTKSRMNTPHTANIDAGSYLANCALQKLEMGLQEPLRANTFWGTGQITSNYLAHTGWGKQKDKSSSNKLGFKQIRL